MKKSASAKSSATSAKYANKLAKALSKIEIHMKRKELHEIETKVHEVDKELKEMQAKFGNEIEKHDRLCSKIQHLLDLQAEIKKIETIKSIATSETIDDQSKAKEILDAIESMEKSSTD